MTQWHNLSPIYLQLQEELGSAILEGRLSEGELLPSIRQLSAQYRLNPQTISKAYQGLVEDELVTKQRGIGMIVAPNAKQKLKTIQKKLFLEEQWPKIYKKMQQLDLTLEELA